MDDLNVKLEEILNDPESMNRVRLMAQSILGDDKTAQEEEHSSGDTSLLGSIDIAKFMGIIEKLERRETDNRTKLLLALKPHLSDRRREKIDTAIKLLKLIDALPLLKDAGIFDLG